MIIAHPVNAVSRRLSLCMIVRDEAEWIEPFLEHHAPNVDEAVVVDTGSSDGTDAAAERAGARVVRIKWPNSFAAARNMALAEATGDWILTLDADEWITDDDMAALRRLAEEGNADAFVLTTRTYTDDSQIVGWAPAHGAEPAHSPEPAQDAALARGLAGYIDVPLIRLHRNDPRILFEGEIHELLAPSVDRAGLITAPSGVIIHHYKELKPAGSAREKNRRYLELSRAKAQRLQTDAHAFEEWGQAAFECGEFAVAAEAFARAIGLAPGVEKYAVEHGLALTRAGRAPEAAAAYEQALSRLGETAELLAGYGESLLTARRPAEAAAALRRCLSLQSNHPRAAVNLSAALIDLGDLPGALQACECARQANPKDDLVFLNAAIAMQGLGRTTEAIETLRQALALNPNRSQTKEALRRLTGEG